MISDESRPEPVLIGLDWALWQQTRLPQVDHHGRQISAAIHRVFVAEAERGERGSSKGILIL